MNKPKIVDFETAKGAHVHARKESRVEKMRNAFKAAREAASRKLTLKKRQKKKGKKKK